MSGKIALYLKGKEFPCAKVIIRNCVNSMAPQKGGERHVLKKGGRRFHILEETGYGRRCTR